MDPFYDLPEDVDRRLYGHFAEMVREARRAVVAARLLGLLADAGLEDLYRMLALKRGCRR